MALHTTTITSTQSYVIPEGVTTMLVEGIGAGKNGVAGTAGSGGAGGDGGAYSATNALSVNEGDTWTATVGTAGGDTSFIRVTGGALTGMLAKGGNTAGASQIAAGVGDTKFRGGSGAAGSATGGGGGGGGAGSSGNGNNAATQTGGTGSATGGGSGGTGPLTGAGAAGSVQGGGGSGGGTLSGAAGAGARGYIVLSYQQNFSRTLSATSSNTSSIVKDMTPLPKTATTTGTATIIRQIGKILSTTSTSTATVIKQVIKTVSATSTGTATMTKVAALGRILTATATGTASLTKALIFNRTFTATATGTAKMLVQIADTILNRMTGGGGTTVIKKISTFIFDD